MDKADAFYRRFQEQMPVYQNIIYHAHQIQHPIPKLRILNYHYLFKISDCFCQKQTIASKQTRPVKPVLIVIG